MIHDRVGNDTPLLIHDKRCFEKFLINDRVYHDACDRVVHDTQLCSS